VFASDRSITRAARRRGTPAVLGSAVSLGYGQRAMPGVTRRQRAVAAGFAAALAAGFVLLWAMRDGLSPTLDASSYLSGTREVSGWHPLTTRLAPSFSNFDVIEFLDRGGRLPFVDFPVGYPLLAGVLALFVGAKSALVLVCAGSVIGVVVLVVLGARGADLNGATLGARLAVGTGIVGLSTYRVLTRSVLSEPLFCVIVVGLLAALLRYRRTGKGWWGCLALAAGAGLVRFVGAPLALLIVPERRRRDGGVRAPLLWGAVAIVLPAVNMLWAGAAGGGHRAGWRGLESADVKLFTRSVGGWVDGRQGNIGLTYFGGEGPAWWSWPLTVAWLAAGVLAVLGVARLVRSRLPEPLELALAASLIITVGVVVGMAGFDSLVAPENRVMLPAGVLVVVGAAWSLRITAARETWLSAAAIVIWWLVAVVPRGPDLFQGQVEAPISADIAEASGASIVIANDADPLQWWTGIPAAYLPQEEIALTGERVDTAPLWAALPCALAEADGVVIVTHGATFFADPGPHLDGLVDAGLLTSEVTDGATLYRPVPDACAG
jgi:hypothetical protein